MKSSEQISKKMFLLLMAIGLLLFALTVLRKDLVVVVARIISMLLITVPLITYMIKEGDEDGL